MVDGLQRLTTFQRFVNNELRLQFKDRPELNRRKFEDLTPKLQNRVEDCNLVLYVIDSKVPERARLDIFERGERRGSAVSPTDAQLPLHGRRYAILKGRVTDRRISGSDREGP